MNTDNCESLKRLEDLIATLTGENGCPWDREQTPMTLADYIIEESHELTQAIRSGNAAEICDELGDLLFLLVFVASYYQKKGDFSLTDSLDAVCAKMVRRHPHVFADARFDSLQEQLKAWTEIKKREKGAGRHGLFASLPDSLPALVKAYRIHSKAASEGFTWPDDEDVEQQVESEWLEWLDACEQKDEAFETHELGDLLFSIVELGRRKGIKANHALQLACSRFLARYSAMEKMADGMGQALGDLSLEEKDALWEKAKAQERDE